MITVRLSSGKILFEEFTDPTLNRSVWEVKPDNPSRYSLTEQFGSLKLFHGESDAYLLTTEPDESYVLDMHNTYWPQVDGDQAGLVVYKSETEKLEILEYFDVEKNERFVYEYLRIIKSGDLYSAYGRNLDHEVWELFGTIKILGAGKVGLVIKGGMGTGFFDFVSHYVRVYKSQQISYLNVSPGQTVRMVSTTGVILDSQICKPENSGVTLHLKEVPPHGVYFIIYDENLNVIHRSYDFDACGGDTFYYGAVLEVFVNGELMSSDSNFFLGYFESSIIDFEVTLKNPHSVPFVNVAISASQYGSDPGWEFVKFSTDGVTYTDTVLISSIHAQTENKIHGRVIRDPNVLASTVEPFKFHLKLLNQ